MDPSYLSARAIYFVLLFVGKGTDKETYVNILPQSFPELFQVRLLLAAFSSHKNCFWCSATS